MAGWYETEMREQLLSIDDPECWRPVGEYWVSSHGRVANPDGDILKPDRHWKGYRRIKTRERKNVPVHKLVVMAFIGPIPEGFTVDHLDENKEHNAPINLEVVTNAENTRRYHQRKRAKQYDCAA